MLERFKENFTPNNILKTVVATALLIEGYYFINSPNTSRTVHALSTPAPECGEIPPITKSIDTIVVLGADKNRSDLHDAENAALLRSVAKIYTEHNTARIVIVGDIPGYKETLMFKKIDTQVDELSHGEVTFGRKNITFLNHSNSYGQGLSMVNTFMHDNDLHYAVAVVNPSALIRINLLSTNIGVNVTPIPAECPNTDSTKRSDTYKDDSESSERLLTIGALFDPEGKFLGALASTLKSIEGR